jgi:hypothetical protein
VCTSHWVSYESLSGPWSTHLSLTERCDIARTDLHTILLGLCPGRGTYRSSDKHLSCSDKMNLDYCLVDMAIITLDSHYFMLSCRPTPPDAMSAPCGQRADNRGTCTSLRPSLTRGWASRCVGPKLLVSLSCVNTCHVGSPDLRTSQSRTCPWDLAHGVPSASFLVELTPSRGVGGVPDPTPHLGQVLGDCLA